MSSAAHVAILACRPLAQHIETGARAREDRCTVSHGCLWHRCRHLKAGGILRRCGQISWWRVADVGISLPKASKSEGGEKVRGRTITCLLFVCATHDWWDFEACGRAALTPIVVDEDTDTDLLAASPLGWRAASTQTFAETQVSPLSGLLQNSKSKFERLRPPPRSRSRSRHCHHVRRRPERLHRRQFLPEARIRHDRLLGHRPRIG